MSEDARAELQSPRRLNILSGDCFPAYVVWELTLACDHACAHCGSRGALARERELSLEEALGLADEIADLGAREVVLIGGEAYLYEGFFEVTRRLSSRGVSVVMTTGGWGVDEALARQMVAAGLSRLSVSVDGLGERHDRIRAKKGSFEQALRALDAARSAGLVIHANTHFNRLNHADLEGLYLLLRERGVRSWQVQLTSPLGRAADRPQMLFQPYDLLDFMPRLAALKERGWREGLLIMPGNNLGYFGPEEVTLRSPRPNMGDHWAGCQAGRFVLGIESDGALKGCPSLQTDAYVGGRWRASGDLRAIWEGARELSFARQRTRADLWGYCAECPLADTCLGGCTFTAHGFFGRPGNNPYCHFRARQVAKRGERERLARVAPAPGKPFDHARFELIVEPADAPEPKVYAPSELVSIRG